MILHPIWMEGRTDADNHGKHDGQGTSSHLDGPFASSSHSLCRLGGDFHLDGLNWCSQSIVGAGDATDDQRSGHGSFDPDWTEYVGLHVSV